jgi:succinate dehydrogenase/fumarate reductase flavoprotein subunit
VYGGQSRKTKHLKTHWLSDEILTTGPLPASDIEERKLANGVVLGAGISGLWAANSTAGAGAKVIVLEKRNTYTFPRAWNAVVNSRLHRAPGIEIPKDEVMTDLMRFGAYHPHPRLIKLWLDESGRVMARLLDMAGAEGIK